MRLGWFLAVFVLAFALVIFVVNRPTHPLTPSIPQPTWGSLTLIGPSAVRMRPSS